MTRALKKRLRRDGLKYKVGNLGELMQENVDQALEHGTLRYRPEHLRLLRGVRETPQVVDVAWQVMAGRLAEDGVEVPNRFDGDKLPADPDYWRLALLYLLLSLIMTVLITLAVVLVSNMVWMTVLIVLISIAGAAAFVWGLFNLTIPVNPTEFG